MKQNYRNRYNDERNRYNNWRKEDRQFDKMYCACSYMINTKDEDLALLRYKTSSPCRDRNVAHMNGMGFIKEAYTRIMSGEITFPGIKNFDKSNVVLSESQYSACIMYFSEKDDIREVLCNFSIEILEIDNYFSRNVIRYYTDDFEMVHVFCRYGLFWYLIANVNEMPIIVKRFWWFTSLDKMVRYMFDEFENSAI